MISICRRFLFACCCVLLGPVAVLAADVSAFPSRTLRLVVPFGPGGAADAIARPLAEKMGQILGQTVVVDNRPGALTMIGADQVAKSAPDGYTLFFTPASHVLTSYLVAKVPYDAINDFTPVAFLGTQPYFLFGNKQQPFENLSEWAAYAKKQPGEVSVGVSDAVTQVIATALASAAGVDVNIVPYKSGGQQNVDLLANTIATAIGTPNLMPQVQQGKLRPLAATTAKRSDLYPDVPTAIESIPGSSFSLDNWFAIAAPKGVPPAIVGRLHSAIVQALAQPDVKKRFDELGLAVPGDTSGSHAHRVMVEYRTAVGPLVRKLVPQAN